MVVIFLHIFAHFTNRYLSAVKLDFVVLIKDINVLISLLPKYGLLMYCITFLNNLPRLYIILHIKGMLRLKHIAAMLVFPPKQPWAAYTNVVIFCC